MARAASSASLSWLQLHLQRSACTLHLLRRAAARASPRSARIAAASSAFRASAAASRSRSRRTRTSSGDSPSLLLPCSTRCAPCCIASAACSATELPTAAFVPTLASISVGWPERSRWQAARLRAAAERMSSYAARRSAAVGAAAAIAITGGPVCTLLPTHTRLPAPAWSVRAVGAACAAAILEAAGVPAPRIGAAKICTSAGRTAPSALAAAFRRRPATIISRRASAKAWAFASLAAAAAARRSADFCASIRWRDARSARRRASSASRLRCAASARMRSSVRRCNAARASE
mmetsp:Transcript_2992/g.12091  ORF Transcript_2992/g.12091 Transcript_2992/m.12091 type:complete len:292 (+) Transcript_2992:743-1618(+)